jgi:hypothetical protein
MSEIAKHIIFLYLIGVNTLLLQLNQMKKERILTNSIICYRKVTDITQGSRGVRGASDARESGGRLGPVTDDNPDLQNLALYFQPVEEVMKSITK